jgi:hypothetical protein
VALPQDGRPAAVLYPFGHPMPYILGLMAGTMTNVIQMEAIKRNPGDATNRIQVNNCCPGGVTGVRVIQVMGRFQYRWQHRCNPGCIKTDSIQMVPQVQTETATDDTL